MPFANAISRTALATSRVGFLCLALACSSTAEPPSKPGEASVRPGVNENFLAEDLDVEGFVEIFEGESREVFVQRERTEREGLARVEVVEGLEDSVELPAASVDLAFVCDTYPPFRVPPIDPREPLHRDPDPGVPSVILDFERIPAESQDWVLGHMRAGKEVFRREIESAGFRFEREVTVEGLKENYVLRFRRP